MSTELLKQTVPILSHLQRGPKLEPKTQKEKKKQNMVADRICPKLTYTQWELLKNVGWSTWQGDLALAILEPIKSKEGEDPQKYSILLSFDFLLTFTEN